MNRHGSSDWMISQSYWLKPGKLLPNGFKGIWHDFENSLTRVCYIKMMFVNHNMLPYMHKHVSDLACNNVQLVQDCMYMNESSS